MDAVLRRSKFDRYIHEDERLRFLARYVQAIVLITMPPTLTDCWDMKDNKCLELAVAGGATCIVSGDHDLLDLTPYQGIRIMPPAVFFATYASSMPPNNPV